MKRDTGRAHAKHVPFTLYNLTAFGQIFSGIVMFLLASMLGFLNNAYFRATPEFDLSPTAHVNSAWKYSAAIILHFVSQFFFVAGKYAGADILRSNPEIHEFLDSVFPGRLKTVVLVTTRVMYAGADFAKSVAELFYLRAQITFGIFIAIADVTACLLVHFIILRRRADPRFDNMIGFYKHALWLSPVCLVLAGMQWGLLAFFGIFSDEFGHVGKPLFLFGGPLNSDAQYWVLVVAVFLGHIAHSYAVRTLDMWRPNVVTPTAANHDEWPVDVGPSAFLLGLYTMQLWLRRTFVINLAFSNFIFFVVQSVAEMIVQGWLVWKSLHDPTSFSGKRVLLVSILITALESLVIVLLICIAAPWNLPYFQMPPPLTIFDTPLVSLRAIITLGVFVAVEQAIASVYTSTTEVHINIVHANIKTKRNLSMGKGTVTADIPVHECWGIDEEKFADESWFFLLCGQSIYWLRRITTIQVATANIIYTPFIAGADFIVVFAIAHQSFQDHRHLMHKTSLKGTH